MAKKIPQRHQGEPRPRVNTKIKKEDMVKVIAGKDKGKSGRVLDVNRETGRVLVEGIGMVKRHTKPNPQRQIKGGIAESERSIHLSNVMVMTGWRVKRRVWAQSSKAGSACVSRARPAKSSKPKVKK